MAKILIVDDSRTSRRMLKNILENSGQEIIGEASNGQEGFEQYITMPVLDGLGTLRKIMEHDPEAKVVMITAAGQKGKMVEAIKLGASEFIQKPYEPAQITSVISNLS